jgi:hypothetical protein
MIDVALFVPSEHEDIAARDGAREARRERRRRANRSAAEHYAREGTLPPVTAQQVAAMVAAEADARDDWNVRDREAVA